MRTPESVSKTYVQFGCGLCAPKLWLNFDSSPTLRLERIPLVGRFVARNQQRFPEHVVFGDIVVGLPIANGSVDAIYASHVLEHLSRSTFEKALANTFALLRPGGVFRLIVPDLEVRAKHYLRALDAKALDANDWFMRSAHLGSERRSVVTSLGGSLHLWMWDFPSMRAALEHCGFVDIRRCEKGDSGDPMFDLVEDEHRFVDGDITELAIHARKP